LATVPHHHRVKILLIENKLNLEKNNLKPDNANMCNLLDKPNNTSSNISPDEWLKKELDKIFKKKGGVNQMVSDRIENLYEYCNKHFPNHRIFAFFTHQKAGLKENQMFVTLQDKETLAKMNYIFEFNERNYPKSFKKIRK